MKAKVLFVIAIAVSAIFSQMQVASAHAMEKRYVITEAGHCTTPDPADAGSCDSWSKVTNTSDPVNPFPWVVYGRFQAYGEGVFVSGGNRGLSRWRLLIDGVDATGWRQIPSNIGCITWGSRMGMDCVHSTGRDIAEGKEVRLDVCMDWGGWQCKSSYGVA